MIRDGWDLDFFYSLSLLTAVDCEALTNPDNGAVNTSSGTTFMNNATYACTSGYMLNGAAIISCGNDGVWFPDPPTCDGKPVSQL